MSPSGATAGDPRPQGDTPAVVQEPVVSIPQIGLDGLMLWLYLYRLI